MTSRLDSILQQYGFGGGATPDSAVAASQLDPLAAPAPGSNTAPDPSADPSPNQNLQQAIDYAHQMAASAAKYAKPIAQAASNVPGVVGAAGDAAQMYMDPKAPVTADVITPLIRRHESSNDYSAVNREGSTASGAYQYTDPTWAGYGGYARAALAPRAVQDARAAQDVAANLARYGGDPFKAIAAHYLPAAAADPKTWTHPYTLRSGKTVSPVADYVRATVANTPLQGQFDAYLKHYSS